MVDKLTHNQKVRSSNLLPATILILCERCKKEHNGSFGSGRFCSRSCANTQIHSKETKEKISTSVKNSEIFKKRNKESHPALLKNQVFCVVCNKKTDGHKTCSKKCYMQQMINAGKKSASKRVLRSKSEIQLFDLLSKKFNCLHNIAMFDGWDADIIIPHLKLAILWNGIWHYQKVTKNHSLLQVQKRDEIKFNTILNYDYNVIVIKDHNNKMSSQKAFDQILNCIDNNQYNLTIF